MNAPTRVIGWGPFRLPGERRRLQCSEAKARELISSLPSGDECAKGHHAWVPWLAVYVGGMEANGINFYTTWCCRDGCNHTEQWDV